MTGVRFANPRHPFREFRGLSRALNRLYLVILDLDRYALLKEIDGHKQPIFAAPGDDDPLKAHQHAGFDAHPPPWLQLGFGAEGHA